MKVRGKVVCAGRTQRAFSKMRCNLCHKLFRAVSKFHRFCRHCKQADELYRFDGWLPGKAGYGGVLI